MDSKTTIADLKKKIAKIEEDRGWNPNIKDLAISISLEVSELLEHFQWDDSEKITEKYKNNSKKREEINMEVADIVIYLGAFLNRLGIDLSQVISKKIRKINIKYPAEKIKSEGDDFYYKQKKKYREK